MTRWQRALYQPSIPMGKDGRRITACEEHRRLSREAAKEGMVLLKNQNNLLPLAEGTKAVLFGKGTVDYVKGGGGSGDVTVSYITDLYQGMKELDRVRIFEPLVDFYRKEVDRQYAEGKEPGMTVEPKLSDDQCREARAFSDTAIISISRFSGEGWDRQSSYDKKRDKKKSIFENGDFYLSKAEKAMVEKVEKYFGRIVVVLNVGGMVDTEWFRDDDRIGSVLLALQGGMEGGRAAAELICGLGNPSGKLCDTYARRLEDYPSSYNFHESENYVDYTEDIYVGYRYFETIPGAGDKVNYPFGFGLSYTSFCWQVVEAGCAEDSVRIRIQVTNTGKYAGKEVLQVYAEAPQGKLGKAKRSLAGFEKTRRLLPGESQLLTIAFPVNSLASYDDLGKVKKSAWVLEAGEYRFHVGTSVRDTVCVDYAYRIEEDIVTEQAASRLAPHNLAKRMLSDGSFEELPRTKSVDTDACEIPPMAKEPIDGLTPASRAVEGVLLWSCRYKKGIHPFGEVAEGKLPLDDFIGQMTDGELAHLLGGQPNTGVANTFGIGNMPEYGIPDIMTADGPAGLRIEKQCGVCATAWPCATLLACTWNPELVEQVGAAGAREVKENNIGVWLTPAVNIHRSPLCGRNFEYYSEDPLLAGTLAAAMVKGIQSQRIAATVKHFALNNKETNRKNSDSRVSERAAREIYLKAFEMIVKTASPWCIMTSYNIINGCRASENRELIDGILRQEWGFEGMVTTDWWTLGEHYKEVKAGNDLKMATGLPDRLLMALEKGVLDRREMEDCGKRILELILKMD